MVRSSFAILFFIRDSRVRKDGTTSIEVVLTVNGERCAFSTGKKVKSCNWDKNKQQVKGKDEEAQSLNNYLKAIKAKLYQKEAELLERGFIITADLLRDAYFDKVESIKERSLFEVFEEHNQEQEKLVGNGVSKATHWVSVYTIRLLRALVQPIINFLYLLFLKIGQCLFSQEHIEYYLYFLIKSAPVIPVFQPPASYTIIAVLMLFSDTNMRCAEKVE